MKLATKILTYLTPGKGGGGAVEAHPGKGEGGCRGRISVEAHPGKGGRGAVEAEYHVLSYEFKYQENL